MLGYTPQAVRAMSLWTFRACLDGYQRSNEPRKDKAPSDDEFYAAVKASEGL